MPVYNFNEIGFSTSISDYSDIIDKKIEEFKSEQVAERIWNIDHTLWKDNPEEITNRLGWLKSADVMKDSLEEINTFVEEIRSAGFRKALLLGMGGSSLAPEVFRLTFGVKEGYIDLAVLDSTHPEMVKGLADNLNLNETLFIVSTKSGGTVETISFMKYFYTLVSGKHGPESAGQYFAAITDPGSGLEQMAKDLNFRKIFINDPNIGGRFSALSFFGIVPAALIGVNISELLNRALVTAESSVSNDTLVNRGGMLGTIMGVLAEHGKDKLTLILSDEIKYIGVWIEQLIAESTGKDRKGILPVESEAKLSPDDYSNDRLFVNVKIKGDSDNEKFVESLISAGYPCITLLVENKYDLGSQFFEWEFATAVAGWVMGIQPYDQPNVESAKIAAREMMRAYIETGSLPVLVPNFENDDIQIIGDVNVKSVKSVIMDFIDQSITENIPGNYISLQAYLNPVQEVDEVLQIMRANLQRKYKMAVTVGYGPRFLHSTGQLHKGDSGNGIVIQFTSDIFTDADIPDDAGAMESAMSFGTLISAQALGDRQALIDNNRNVLRINLKDNVIESIKLLSNSIS